jgi:hypothetical protein
VVFCRLKQHHFSAPPEISETEGRERENLRAKAVGFTWYGHSLRLSLSSQLFLPSGIFPISQLTLSQILYGYMTTLSFAIVG